MKRKIISATSILLLILIIGQGFPFFNITPLIQITPTISLTSTNTPTPTGNGNLFAVQSPDPNLFLSAIQAPLP
jgi:hypothetical protein